MDNIGNRIVLLIGFLLLIGVGLTYLNIRFDSIHKNVKQQPTYRIYQLTDELVEIEQVSNRNSNITTIDSVSYYLELNNH